MSRTPYFYVERYNEELNRWILQHPFIPKPGNPMNYNNLIRADLFPYNGCHEVFSIVTKGTLYPIMKGIHYKIPHNADPFIKDEYEKCIEMHPDVYWFTYADLLIYLFENPKVPNHYEKLSQCDNPMFVLKKRIDAFLEVMDDWDWENDYSCIRIIYWII